MSCDLVTASHLGRKAVVYIRQSSPHQVLTNRESLRLQYALRQRARELGWREPDIEVIDRDLGRSGAGAEQRAGFKDLIARVTLGEVGLILSADVTRLTRNCSDWYPLLDLCGYRECLIADRDGVYDPGTQNGRLLLGLKGTISEMELHTLRARLTAGLLNKARRGELALRLPVGLARDPTGTVVKSPDREVQARIALVFATFLEKRSAGKVLRTLLAEGLALPRRDRHGDITWRPPTRHAICAILKNPAYAGAFVYGRTRTFRPPLPGARSIIRVRPRSEWTILIRDVYPAYIGWESFERIAATLRDNHTDYTRGPTRGIPRRGDALLHGIVWCGACGHKIAVQYKGRTRYICNHLHRSHGLPKCQNIRAEPVDAAVAAAFLEAVAPAELEAWERASAAEREAEAALREAAAQQVERLRYRAALAERQFNRVDPDNRLVAGELERRWEVALRELRDAERALTERAGAHDPPSPPTADTRATFAAVAGRLPELWCDPRLGHAQRKALLRCLIDKVVLERIAPDRAAVRIVWRGGEDTTLTVDTSAHALRDLSGIGAMRARVLELAQAGLPDAEIALTLTREGFRSPLRDVMLASTVRKLRLRAGVLRWPEGRPRGRTVRGWLTVPQLAARLAVDPAWIHHRIRNGTIAVPRDGATRMYLFPDAAETIAAFQRLRCGHLRHLDFGTIHHPPGGHQRA
jgi:DNA invertase Pin-like site-specific DNA recombinase